MSQGANRERLRRRNLSTVLGQVHRTGQLSRSALTRSTGLSRSTIAALVADLQSRGLVDEGPAASTGTRGRPSTLVHTRPDGIGVVAVDVQVARSTVALVGLGGAVRDRVHLDHAPHGQDVGAVVAALTALVADMIDAAAPTRVVGVGISVAGIVRGGDGHVHLAPNLGWRDVHLAAQVQSGLPPAAPTVRVGNEADLGAMAEHVRGAGTGTDDLVYVSGEVGVGGGVIVGGRPLVGSAGYAGEVGHMVVDPAGRPCHCGSRGCWETEVGQDALLDLLGRGPGRGHDAVDQVLADAAAGDAWAQDALATLGGRLGLGLANLVNLFNPQKVVLGGMFGRAHPHLADAVRAELDRRALGPARALAELCPAQLGEDSSLLGAAELALSATLADPTTIPPIDPATHADPTTHTDPAAASG